MKVERVDDGPQALVQVTMTPDEATRLQAVLFAAGHADSQERGWSDAIARVVLDCVRSER